MVPLRISLTSMINKIISICLFLLLAISLWSQTKELPVIDVPPKFPGGSTALVSWIKSNLRYPILAQEQRIEGDVVCAFWVEKDGSVKNTYIIRSSHELLSKAALRALGSMPRWSPGRENGQPVRVRYTVPFTFCLVPDSLSNKKTIK